MRLTAQPAPAMQTQKFRFHPSVCVASAAAPRKCRCRASCCRCITGTQRRPHGTPQSNPATAGTCCEFLQWFTMAVDAVQIRRPAGPTWAAPALLHRPPAGSKPTLQVPDASQPCCPVHHRSIKINLLQCDLLYAKEVASDLANEHTSKDGPYPPLPQDAAAARLPLPPLVRGRLCGSRVCNSGSSMRTYM